MKKRVIIMGAAGRDFHNFNVYFRDNPNYEVVCFTAEQIPYISERKYPKVLAGKNYPNGIAIHPEAEIKKLILDNNVDEVILAYSDLSHKEVMNKASLALAAGADFRLMGPKTTMIKSKKPVISVCAVRTGAGKSPTTRKVCSILKSFGKKYAIVRHPMPYGDLSKQIVQRFASVEDLKKNNCTIEEMEEYLPHIENGNVVFAGVDYAEILKEAEKEGDIIIWDGGNNDLPFYKPDLHIVVADPRRAGDEINYYPGEANFRMADIIIVNKVDTAEPKDVESVINNARIFNPNAKIIKASMENYIDKPELVKGKKILIIEDGPTATHGNLVWVERVLKKLNVNYTAVDPRPHVVGSLKEVYKKYPHLGVVLPAEGYSSEQMHELEKTINSIDCDSVLIGTPVDLRRFLKINKPAARIFYELKELSKPSLEDLLRSKFK